MFYHRVLPPPSNLATPSTTGLRPPKRDALLENRIMTNEDTSPYIDQRDFQGHLPKSSTGNEKEARGRAGVPDENPSPTGVLTRSSTRLLQKHASSRSPISENRRLSRVDPSLAATEGESSRPVESPSQVCLCQPDPKVPRPRNAFILFRQHHQSAVVAQNPGLANPDISKIIGDAWRTSSADTKNHWKRLAEEEKIRHQKQYPDYRYQPRRAGRTSIATSTSTDPDTQRCLKCGGKTMPTPHNLPTPGSPYSPRAPVQPGIPSGNATLSRGSRYIGSPNPPHAVDPRRYAVGSNGSIPLSRDGRLYHSSVPSSPGSKRRRIEPIHTPSIPAQGTVGRSSIPQDPRRPSLPHPELVPRHPSVALSRPQLSSAHPTRTSGFVLAPLKIDDPRDLTLQAKAVEAMVMSIPPINKIKVLAKLSRPLPSPGPASPPHTIRGALVAVEGKDEEALKIVTTYLKDSLERDKDYTVRIISKASPKAYQNFGNWLDTIRSYHNESEEIVNFMTSVSRTSSDKCSISTSTASIEGSLTEENSSAAEMTGDARAAADLAVALSTEPVEKRIGSAEDLTSDQAAEGNKAHEPAGILAPNPEQMLSQNPALKNAIPVAIIPRYQLTLTDVAASTVPILDEYSPTDHWQWMATLWRGIVGPDVTIEVSIPSSQDNGTGNGSTNVSPASKDGDGDVRTGGSDERNDVCRLNGNSGPSMSPPVVDVKLAEARAVFLRGEVGGKVSEAGLRRMAFEVGEWLRAVGEKEKGSR